MLRRRVREVPDLMLGKGLGLGMNFQLVVVGDEDRLGGVAPGGCFLHVNAELVSAIRMTLDGSSCRPEVVLCHQVGIDIVVGDRAVLVGAGDAVDAKSPLGVVVTKRAPESCRFDEQLDSGLAFKRIVLHRRLVAIDRMGDVRVDVEGGASCWPVPGALLSGDRAPGKGRASEPDSLARSRARSRVAWRQSSASRAAFGSV